MHRMPQQESSTHAKQGTSGQLCPALLFDLIKVHGSSTQRPAIAKPAQTQGHARQGARFAPCEFSLSPRVPPRLLVSLWLLSRCASLPAGSPRRARWRHAAAAALGR